MSSFDNAMESATSFVLDASLRTTIVLLTTILIAWLLRSAAASARRLVWIGGLGASLMILGMVVFGPHIPVTIPSDDEPLDDVVSLATPETEFAPAVPREP